MLVEKLSKFQNIHFDFIARADDKLLGICYYNEEDDSCTVYSSLEGGALLQINGEGFYSTAQDQQISFIYSGANIGTFTFNED